jgi:hypothetical protein
MYLFMVRSAADLSAAPSRPRHSIGLHAHDRIRPRRECPVAAAKSGRRALRVVNVNVVADDRGEAEVGVDGVAYPLEGFAAAGGPQVQPTVGVGDDKHRRPHDRMTGQAARRQPQRPAEPASGPPTAWVALAVSMTTS